MKLRIEQIALCPPDPEKARVLLSHMGGGPWIHDDVIAVGAVFETEGITNTARLDFDHTLLEARELEILQYIDGPNWMEGEPPRASHLGAHCTEEELAEWREFFVLRGIGIAQEVFTKSHSNDRGRRYHYIIFNTFPILGIDIKFIVRRDPE